MFALEPLAELRAILEERRAAGRGARRASAEAIPLGRRLGRRGLHRPGVPLVRERRRASPRSRACCGPAACWRGSGTRRSTRTRSRRATGRGWTSCTRRCRRPRFDGRPPRGRRPSARSTRARSSTSTRSSRDDVLAFSASTSWIASRDDRDEVLAGLASLLPEGEYTFHDADELRRGRRVPELGLSFGNLAETYHRIRPPYSQALLDRAQEALELERGRACARPRRRDRPPDRGATRAASRTSSPSSRTSGCARCTAERSREARRRFRSTRRASTPSSWARRSTGSIPRRRSRSSSACSGRRGGLAIVSTHWWETEPPLPDAALQLLSEPWQRFQPPSAVRPGTTLSTVPVRAAPLRAVRTRSDRRRRDAARALLDDELARGAAAEERASLFARVRPLLAGQYRLPLSHELAWTRLAR